MGGQVKLKKLYKCFLIFSKTSPKAVFWDLYYSSSSSTRWPNPLQIALVLADEVVTWTTSTNLSHIERGLQTISNILSDWMSDCRMTVSVSKTNYYKFNKSGRHVNNLSIKYNGTKLKTEKNPRFLGVILDPGLRFHKHADSLIIRAKKRINLMRRIKGKDWDSAKDS